MDNDIFSLSDFGVRDTEADGVNLSPDAAQITGATVIAPPSNEIELRGREVLVPSGSPSSFPVVLPTQDQVQRSAPTVPGSGCCTAWGASASPRLPSRWPRVRRMLGSARGTCTGGLKLDFVTACRRSHFKRVRLTRR